ncbi:mitochondrial arginine/ornithine transport system ATPase (ArgK) [Andalucia godoyi]|uniref:Mitochondrial arginine/ornithine transport system ATPase (ArgK) n=1 Tax=Andalucia godoyi TaxID=505711 RepID=A0A8K0AIA5_ANDGO|nr:mitochondrial arginine/ornithine transport system ATPase (ArgK) [Andalucia godoyi]|eukprot:ANDGO_06889.mRNA.1 mitochondrial arginine/ornithine transport system ATPase (ArgK)
MFVGVLRASCVPRTTALVRNYSLTGRELADRIISADRIALSRGITLLESTKTDHHVCVQDAVSRILVQRRRRSHTSAFRIGISGPPGAGKSTLIESLGIHLCNSGVKVAVLAIDPSSTVTGGSILGDKTRMTELSRHPLAYVRPSPTRGVLGGVTASTYDAMLLCEAAGFEVVFVETVGVGQSETVVAELADMVALVVYPGGGDELQGIKKGIVEVADMIVVNKADGENASRADHTKADFESALSLLRPQSVSWKPPVLKCSAFQPATVSAVWETMAKFKDIMTETGELQRKRLRIRQMWLKKQIREELMTMLLQNNDVMARMKSVSNSVEAETMTPREAAQQVIDAFMSAVTQK